MAELMLERRFEATPEQVFDFVTKTENLLKWWGPEGMTVPEHNMDFQRPGPWMSVMMNAEGQRYKVSGHVTHVDPPKSVGFTWAWHDETDRRGVESHVIIRLVPAQDGSTQLTLSHAELPDEEAAKNHRMGWESTLNKLERLISA